MRLKKLSLLLALTLLVSVSALPVTAHAGGSKDTTPPTLTASLEGDALKIESSDDLSGVEAVFVDENRINSLTDGKASVALKDYAGTEKQVSIYAKDYAGNRSDAVKMDNPYPGRHRNGTGQHQRYGWGKTVLHHHYGRGQCFLSGDRWETGR